MNSRNKWELGTIIKRDKYRPRAYHIKLDSGRVYIRNRRFTKKCNVPYNYMYDDELENIIDNYNLLNSKKGSKDTDFNNEQNTNLHTQKNVTFNPDTNNVIGSNSVAIRKSNRVCKIPKRFEDFVM